MKTEVTNGKMVVPLNNLLPYNTDSSFKLTNIFALAL